MKRLLVLAALSLGAVAGSAAWLLREPALASFGEPLSDGEVRAWLKRSCQNAAARDEPLLVEFSAPWCEHCRAVKQAVRDDGVQRMLERFTVVSVNIGEGHELDELRRELGALAIPAWVIVTPAGCERPVASWRVSRSTYPRGAPRALEAFLSDSLSLP